ncbi:DMT family transporter [Zestomonas thermotolerans]|uniref:DMT family transporter n=1 Tax=Zestomonas thermotolerans TaxID=157784 RepID=UPI000360DDC8|nr:DMT family transporter [Pseudomonas thermotolerans]MBO2510967.1 EamA/RhaT family transporter [Gammaproteobacteria bacterium]
MASVKTSPALAWGGLVLACLFWAGNALVARAFSDAIPPVSLAFWRWSLALVMLLPFVAAPLWRHRQQLCRAGWRLWLLAALGISAYNSLLYTAAHSTVALNLTLVNTCLPLAMFLGSGVLLGEWPSRRAWAGIGVASLGLLWLISRGDWRALAGLSFNPGDLLMLLAVCDWALYTLLLRRWAGLLQAVPGLVLLGALILLGVPLLLPFFLWELASGAHFAPSVENLAAIGYTALCASLVAYFLWNHGTQVLGAARAALSNYLLPVFTALLAWLLLGEGLQPYHWAGGGLIFAGLLLANRPR